MERFQYDLSNLDVLDVSTGIVKEFEDLQPLYFCSKNTIYKDIGKYFIFKNVQNIDNFSIDFLTINNYFNE